MYGDPLTRLERDAISTILRHDHPIADALRAQLDVCRIKSRRFTGVGFFTDLVVPQALAIEDIGHLHLGDADADIHGVAHGAGFVLFIADGMLAMLERFTYDEPWPDVVGRCTVRPLDHIDPPDLRALDRAKRRRC